MFLYLYSFGMFFAMDGKSNSVFISHLKKKKKKKKFILDYIIGIAVTLTNIFSVFHICSKYSLVNRIQCC